MRKVITLSGLACSGKGTLARTFAKKYGWRYVDIGLIFRALAFTSDTYREFSYEWDGERARIIYHGWAGDKDITRELLTEEVAGKTSKMASLKRNLELMERKAEKILEGEDNIICDGRNAGTTIFPSADFKFYITANEKTRAERRLDDLRRSGFIAGVSDVLEIIRERDRLDSEREFGKAEKPEGAITIDTDKMSVEEAVEFMASIVFGRGENSSLPVIKIYFQ